MTIQSDYCRLQWYTCTKTCYRQICCTGFTGDDCSERTYIYQS